MSRSLAVAAVLAGALALTACGGGSDQPDGSASSAPSTAPSMSATSAPSSAAAGAVTSKGVTVGNPKDLTKAPQGSSAGTGTPTTLEYKDLVVGKGAAAGPTSTVSVQYEGLLYAKGTVFDSSWANGGKPISFPLTGVVPGFTQGIGGTKDVPPMKVGGRRIMILPAELGYGASGTPDGSIPANTPIVFIVDLVSAS